MFSSVLSLSGYLSEHIPTPPGVSSVSPLLQYNNKRKFHIMMYTYTDRYKIEVNSNLLDRGCYPYTPDVTVCPKSIQY